jgi:hypothetical protein
MILRDVSFVFQEFGIVKTPKLEFALADRTSTVTIFFLTRWALMERWQIRGTDTRLEIQGISIFTVRLLKLYPYSVFICNTE